MIHDDGIIGIENIVMTCNGKMGGPFVQHAAAIVRLSNI